MPSSLPKAAQTPHGGSLRFPVSPTPMTQCLGDCHPWLRIRPRAPELRRQRVVKFLQQLLSPPRLTLVGRRPGRRQQKPHPPIRSWRERALAQRPVPLRSTREQGLALTCVHHMHEPPPVNTVLHRKTRVLPKALVGMSAPWLSNRRVQLGGPGHVCGVRLRVCTRCFEKPSPAC